MATETSTPHTLEAIFAGRESLMDAEPNGRYSTPRACPCGELHYSRDLYWHHRIDAETRAALASHDARATA